MISPFAVTFVYQGHQVKVKVTAAKTGYTEVTKYTRTFAGGREMCRAGL